MFCSNCGSQMLEGAKFCQKCGTKLNADTNVEIQSRLTEEPVNTRIRHKRTVINRILQEKMLGTIQVIVMKKLFPKSLSSELLSL